MSHFAPSLIQAHPEEGITRAAIDRTQAIAEALGIRLLGLGRFGTGNALLAVLDDTTFSDCKATSALRDAVQSETGFRLRYENGGSLVEAGAR